MSDFFKRWSELKQAQTKPVVTETPAEVQVEIQEVSIAPDHAKPSVNSVEEVSTPQAVGPTLEDVAKLHQDSDFSKFVNAEVGDEVHHAAMKKLFSDPHYNIMDGLDIYIDDYSKEDPLPAGMLEKMVQSSMLGLFNQVEEKISDTVSIDHQSELEVKEETPNVTPITLVDVSEQNPVNQTTLTKGSTDDSDTRL